MQEAEKQHLHKMYDLQFAAFRKAYQDACHTPVENSQAVVDRRGLNTVGSTIGKRAQQILLVHQSGELRGRKLENHCMETTFSLLQVLIWAIHQAMSNAGPTLARIMSESMMEVNNCTLELLKCTILYEPYRSPNDWGRIPGLVQKVVDACESLVNSPKTNSAAIAVALAQVAGDIIEVAGDINGAFLKMENEARFYGGRSNKQGDSASKSYGKEETNQITNDGTEEIIITGLVIGVVTVTVPVVEELAIIIGKWDDNYISGLDMLMEDLLRTSINIRDHIYEIKRSILPLQDVSAYGALAGMENSVNYLNNKLGPPKCGVEEFFHKLAILRTTTVTAKAHLLKLTVNNISVGDLADKFQGIGLSH